MTGHELIARQLAGAPVDAAEIARALSLIAEPGQVVELRALEVSEPNYKAPHTVSGYFDDWTKLAEAARRVSPHAKAVYITPNPVNAALLARASNRARAINGKDPTTSDSDITVRRWLLIDFDPARPSGISATESEHAAAIACGRNVRDWLTARGWPEPIRGDSGNGAHLLYRVDLPATDGRLVERILKALAFVFDDDAVKVDTGVHNPARIWKLYGTWARKGDDTPERPHRLACILEAPPTLEVVGRELLEALAATLPAEPQPARSNHANGQPFNLDEWIAQHGLDLLGPHPWQGGRKWILKVCPWDSSHTNRSAYLVQLPSGAIAAGCHHNSCQGKDWHAIRDLIEPGWKSTLPKRTRRKASAVITDREAQTDDDAPTYARTDMGNGKRLAERHADKLRHVFQWGYLVWDGRRWERDETGAVMRLAKETALSIWEDVTRIAQSGADTDTQKAWAQFAYQSQNGARLNEMIRLAASEPDIVARHTQFDSDPHLLNCRNGTLNLRAAELRAHDPADLLTRIASAPFDAAALCPTWLSFLNRIFDHDAALIDFIRRAVGYTLTGDTREQCLFFLYGTGKNGKTTFAETLLALMGEYGRKTPAETLLAKHNDGAIPNDVAALVGVRLVVAAELPEGRRLNESLVKDLTGGDTITARFLHKEYFEFHPQFKLWLYGNHKPVIRGTDDGIWRRVRLIPFTVTIPESERDSGLPDKLRAELPGILAWAVSGCLDWQRNGLRAPPSVTTATDSYRAEQDTLAAFLEECCVTSPNAEIKTGELLEAYKANSGDKTMTAKAFSMRLRDRGFTPGQGTGGVRVWRGVGLLNTGP